MASVVATTAPRTKPSRQSNPAKTHFVVAAMPTTVNPTRPKASMRMLTKLNLNSRQEVTHAAEYSSGGKTTRKTTSGFSETFGIPGTKLSTRPAITSTMG